MNAKVYEIFSNIKESAIRYPYVFCMSLLAAIAGIILVDMHSSTSFEIEKILIVTTVGISLMFALKIASQRTKIDFIWEILGILFLVGLYFILPKSEDDFTVVYAFILIPVYILSHLLVAFIAFLKRENSEHNFWQFNKSLFVNFFLTIVFTGVLTGGVLLAVLAIENLFNWHIDNDLYAEISIFLLIFGSTVIFLLFNNSGLNSLEKEENYPVILKFFTQFVLIPLLSIYVVILYFYCGKILINWELPRGWVSYLVLAYSLIGILALLLVHPLKEFHVKSWVKLFSKIFYFTLIPLLILLFTAIFTRLLEYGYTEPRYFVLLLAIWLTVIVGYFILRKNPTIKFIPISLFAFGVFALIFPYLNAFSVSKRSQKNQLETILAKNNLLVNGKIDFTKPIQDTDVREIVSKFEFLHDRAEKEYISTYFDEKNNQNLSTGNFYDLTYQFTSKTESTNTVNTNEYVNLNSKGGISNIEGYHYMISNFEYLEKSYVINSDKFYFDFKPNQDAPYSLKINDEVVANFLPDIKKVFETHSTVRNYQDVENIWVEKKLEKYDVKVFFGGLSKYNSGSEKTNYSASEILAFIKVKN